MTSPSPWDPIDEPEKPPKGKTSANTPQHSETRAESKGVSIAYKGKRISSDHYSETINSDIIKNAPGSPNGIPIDAEFDMSDLAVIHREINRARTRLYFATEKLKIAQRDEIAAKMAYNRAHNLVLIGVSGGTEKTRQAVADLETDDLHLEFLVAQQVSSEWLQLMRTIKSDLDTLQGLSHNMRAQMQMT